MRKLKVAITGPLQLGDGIILCYFCHNLAACDIDVVFYHNALSKLNSWFKNFEVRPLPPAEILGCQFDDEFDFIFHFEAPGFEDKFPPNFFESFNDKQMYIAIEEVHSTKACLKKNLKSSFSNEIVNNMLLHEPVILRSHYCENKRSYVDCLTAYMNEIGICNPNTDLLEIPSHLQYRLHNKRIIINPTSAFFRKNWAAKKYLKLARQLKHNGYNPLVVLSPGEIEAWQQFPENGIATAELGLVEMFEVTYQSGFFIGNDSGHGHVASLLRIPTLTLHPKKANPNDFWRPGYRLGKVIGPVRKLPSWSKTHRRSTLNASRVFKEFVQLVASGDSYSI